MGVSRTVLWSWVTLSLLLVGQLVAVFAPPPSFDARTAYPQCLPPVRNEGQCDSTFLLDSINDLSSSACLLARIPRPSLSAQYVSRCCVNCDAGCQGSDASAIERWLTVNGTLTQACAGLNQTCPAKKCADNSPLRFYRAKFIALESVEEIQNAIMATGPVLAFVDATTFEYYTGGVMSCPNSTPSLDDVVSLLGWGTQGGTPYWIGVNSWGQAWGENGYFRIARGKNACGIETVDYAVQYIDR